ncbi:glutaredoxin-like protein NrdH [Pseudoclavibacter alba]|uniref:Glutaredoxin-like protein NrdH n=1 Tax=Pseudoclavibacter albus TaxID=272241 RepID=A0ABT2HXN0_9MICO|nr:glutaredoxin-like protein NrdH [Pseudoclavibacter alba]MCT2043076.1 glutaredoxin-like protein NrdH [Pseudoclavibacter alba]
MTTLTIYSTPVCQQCKATYRFLDTRNIDYTIVDVTENPSAREYITEELGYSQAPVVVADDHDHWSGFRPDQLMRFA